MNEEPPIYKLVSGDSSAACANLVNEHLRDGYELYGEPFSSPEGISQAMLKYPAENSPSTVPH